MKRKKKEVTMMSKSVAEGKEDKIERKKDNSVQVSIASFHTSSYTKKKGKCSE
jgi:hypothetical protein